jgi:hypothetical protein
MQYEFDPEIGQCRRHAPGGNGNNEGTFPVVKYDAWCGQHKSINGKPKWADETRRRHANIAGHILNPPKIEPEDMPF